jgi:hypothetical protein
MARRARITSSARIAISSGLGDGSATSLSGACAASLYCFPLIESSMAPRIRNFTIAGIHSKFGSFASFTSARAPAPTRSSMSIDGGRLRFRFSAMGRSRKKARSAFSAAVLMP